MCRMSLSFSPVSTAAFAAVKAAVLQNRLPVLTTHLVGDLADLSVLCDAVAVFLTILERHAVHDKMIVRAIM